MTTNTSERDPVEALADSFLERLRRGEHPAVSEYVEKYPELADEIRSLFPTLAMVERLGPEPAALADGSGDPIRVEGVPLRQLGEYRVIREVGRGGMGVVYEAEQESLGRRVALKVLPAHAATDAMHLKRFHREARAAARLHHTNIVPVFDVGEHAGTYYYAMQFIQGQGLDEVFVELRRLRGDEPPVRPPVAATESFAEQHHRADVTGTIVRGLVCGTFERTASRVSDADDDPPDRSSATECDTNPKRERGSSLALRASVEGAAGGDASPSSTGRIVTDATNEWSARPTGESATAGSSSSLTLSGQFGVSESDEPYFHSVARLAVQVAEALAHAHAQGVLHRDIKPSNLILDTAGVIWVTDFGLAKNEGENLTHTGDVVGTLRYMAPERFRGRADARSDIYSLGLTLYEFLTLQPVFPESDRARLVQRVLHEDPPRPRKIDRHVPRDLETIVLKVIDKDPRHRYESAAQLADDLRLFLADKPIQARRASTAERLWRWCRRNPAVAGLAASVLSLLTVIAVGASLSAIKLRRQTTELGKRADQLAEQRNNAVANLSRAEAAEGLANRRLFESYRNEARAERWSRRPGQRFDSLTAIRNAAALLPELTEGSGTSNFKRRRNDADFANDDLSRRRLKFEVPDPIRLELRNQAIASMALPDLRRIASWPSERRRTGWAFDANVERYARGDMEGNVSIRRITDDAELMFLPGFGMPAWSIHFSHDGRYLAARYEHNSPATLYVWDLTRGAGFQPANAAGDDRQAGSLPHIRQAGSLPHIRQAGSLPHIRQAGSLPHVLTTDAVILKLDAVARHDAIAFAPDDQQIAVGRDDHSISIYRLADGAEQSRFSPGKPPVPPTDLCFDPTGTRLAIASVENKHLQIRHLVTGKVASLHHPDGIRQVAWHPGGTLLAAACGDQRAYLWDIDTGRRHSVLEGHEQQVVGVSFDPTGRLLATTTWGTTRLWDVASGAQLLAAEGQCGQFSSDGRRLGFVVGWEIGAWEVAASRELRTLLTGAWSVDSSPDGSMLALGTNEGVELWDVSSGTRVAAAPIGKTMSALFHPDGRELVTTGPQGVHRLPIERNPGSGTSNFKRRRNDAEFANGDLSRRRLKFEVPDPLPGFESGQPQLNFGPPKKLPEVGASDGRACLDQTGGKLVLDMSGDHAVVIDLDDPTKRVRLQAHPNHHYVAIGPDGRWAATGTWQGNGVRVCDAQTGELAADLLPDSVSATVAFSPDGRWLVIGTGTEYSFFEVGTWQQHHRIARDQAGNRPGHIAFTRDGRLAAIAHSRPLVELVDPHTGRQLAMLEPPNPGTLGWLCFTPDGSHLAAVANNTIHLWDLRSIREQLAAIGLDWDPAADLSAPRTKSAE